MSSLDGFLEPLRAKLDRSGHLAGDDWGALSALPLIFRDVPAGREIVRAGERSDRCSILIAGFACRSKILRDGSRQILSVYMPGDFLDLNSLISRSFDCNVQMLTPGKTSAVPCDALLKLLDARPRLQRAIWTQTAIEASIFGEWVANVGRRDAQARIAHLLCEFAVRLRTAGLPAGNGLDLPMTQAQIADATGLTTVHVNRVLQKFRRWGLIKRDSKFASIEDWEGLVEAADFEPHYLGVEWMGSPLIR